MTPTLQDAIAAVRAGETERAQLLAADVIRDNPHDAHAWYLLSQLVDSDARRALYLRKTLALDPDHARARAEFDALPAAATASLGWADGEAVAEEIGQVTQPLLEIEAMPEAAAIVVDEPLLESAAAEPQPEPAAAEAQPEPAVAALEAEAVPEWLRPLSPEPVPVAAVPAEEAAIAAPSVPPVSAAVTTPAAPAPARPRTPPPPPARRQGNGALAALLILLILLTLAVLAVLAYLLLV